MNVMKKCCVIVVSGLLLLSALPTVGYAAEPDVIDGYTYNAVLSDEFDGSDLEGWTWQNNNRKNYSVSDGHLHINSYIEDSAGDDNLLRRTAPVTGDYLYELRFKPNMDAIENQAAGLNVYQDWSNRKEFFGVSKKEGTIVLGSTDNLTGYPQLTPDVNGYVTLRVIKEGENYSFYYEKDGQFVKNCEMTMSYAPEYIALFARYSGYSDKPAGPDDNAKIFTASFDYARVYTKDVPPEPVVPDEIEGYTYSEALSNEFNSFDGWRWVGASNDKNQVSNGHLSIHSYVVNPTSSENTATRTDAVEGDFLYEVRFKSDAGEADFQNAGIFIWDGNGDWVDKFHYQVGSKGSNYFVANEDKTAKFTHITADADGYFRLRVIKEGNEYTLQYVDQATGQFADLTKVTLEFAPVHVGVFALFGDVATYPQTEDDAKNFVADFDYARVYTKDAPMKPGLGTAAFYNGDAPLSAIVGGAYTVTAKLPYSELAEQPTAMLLALYKNGRLVSCYFAQGTLSGAGTLTVDMPVDIPEQEAGQYSIAAYVWDSLAGRKPIAPGVTLP